MKTQTWTAGVLALGLITACAQNAPVETETPELGATTDDYTAFVNEAYTVAGASEADLDALVATLPDYADLTWDTKSFDPASGATSFEGLRIGFGTDQRFGLVFETAKLWGFDGNLLAARLNGERFDETGPLFARMEGTNVSYFGVVPAFNGFIEDMLANFDEAELDGFEFGLDEFEVKTERLAVSGLSLRPWELSLLPPEIITDFDEDIPQEVVDFTHFGQQGIAVLRAISVDKSVSLGSEVSLKFRQPGATVEGVFTVDMAATENVEGFDIGKSTTRGYASSNTTAYSDATTPGDVITMSGFPAGFTLAQQETYEVSTVENMKLDTLMGYLARSELPEMQVRDLLSLGTWEVTDYVSKLNDKTILTADRGFFDGSEFEWVIPSSLSFGFEGATLNTGEVTDFFFTFFEAFLNERSLEELDEEEMAQIEMVREGVLKAVELMPEYGLDQIPFNASFDANWASNEGATDFKMRLDLDGFGRSEFDLGLNLPTYDALLAAYQAEDRDTAFEETFQSAFAFLGGRWMEEDAGGYDKMLGFANAIGKEYPDQGWGAMLGSMEPAQMRTYLGTMTRLAKPAAAEEFPPAADWIESVANYLESGGSIEIKSAPPAPITSDLIDSYESEPEPETIVEIFGLTVTHTK